MQALLLIDLQYDFMPGGALAVAGGDEVVAVANRLMGAYAVVVATQDWHPANHASFASQHPGRQVGEVIALGGGPQILWPDHCVQGTRGAELHADLERDGIDEVVRKGADREIDSYSGFFDNDQRRTTGLERLLRTRGVDAVHVMGLATDFCVKFTALDALRLGFRTSVIGEGCRAVNRAPGDGAAAIREMVDAGVTIVQPSGA